MHTRRTHFFFMGLAKKESQTQVGQHGGRTPPLGYWHGFPTQAQPSAHAHYPILSNLNSFNLLDDVLFLT